MTPKELKKLADMCRKAGIKHYKQGDIEFTLSDEAPVKVRGGKVVKAGARLEASETAPDADYESDSLTDEQLMFYSVQDLPEKPKDQ